MVVNGDCRGHTKECSKLTKLSLCTYGILMSSKCGSDYILSAASTEPRLWIALCSLKDSANQSLIPLHPGPIRVTRTIKWQQAITPADPGVRSLRRHTKPKFITFTVQGFLRAYCQLHKMEFMHYDDTRLYHAFKKLS